MPLGPLSLKARHFRQESLPAESQPGFGRRQFTEPGYQMYRVNQWSKLSVSFLALPGSLQAFFESLGFLPSHALFSPLDRAAFQGA